MKSKIISNIILFILISGFAVNNLVYSFDSNSVKQSKKSLSNTPNLQEELIGGLIDKSDLKIGFLNNGRFCAPLEFIPYLPSALYGKYGYLGLLDLWVGIPEGFWTPEVWHPDSQKYVSLGPTVSGTIFDPQSYGTDWSTINATKGVFYTGDLLYSNIYKSLGKVDFILSPTSDYEQTWPRDPLIGFRKWPGRWKKDALTGEPTVGTFFGDQDIFVSFDDKRLADQYYPEETYYYRRGGEFHSERGYSIGAEVLAQVVCFQESYLSNMVIFDLQIINTTSWDYHDTYIGIYYASDNPWYWIAGGYPEYPGLKPEYIKNEYNDELDEVIPYNLSYNYNSILSQRTDSTYFGVQFLKTPLAELDQIDNDGDGMTDEPEGEYLGLTGWHYFLENNIWIFGKREKMQYQILAGDTTGLGWMIDSTCFFANLDGNLDPNFDSPEGITDASLYGRYHRSKRGVVQVVFNVMSCGPINWASGDTLNFVFAVLVADNLDKLKYSARIARKIVTHEYYCPVGPPPPKVTAVPQDGKVTLYWDRSAETAKNYFTGYQDFEGYKIYRTTSNPVHNEWGTPIYDHYGNLINFIPIARCDFDNGIQGYERVYPFQDLGKDTGLFHTWIDTNVTNGVTYWYSVCSYNHGIVADKNFNPMGYSLSPMQECPKGTDLDKDVNLVKVIPGVMASDFHSPVVQIEKLYDFSGNGSIKVSIIDLFQVTGHDYLISFEDTTYGFAVYDLYDETKNRFIYEKVQQTNGEEGIIFDGIQLTVQRYDDMEVINEKSYWYKFDTGDQSECTWSIYGGKLTWDPYPYEYDIRFTDKLDTSVFMKKTAPFEIWNTVLNQKCLWDIYYDSKTDTTDSLKKTWSSGDMIYIWDEFNEKNKFTLRIIISEKEIYTYQGLVNNPPRTGDVAHIALKRPFRTGDQFRIKTTAMQKKEMSQTKLNDVKVVPNPYIVEAGWELGRNESKIQFTHLPSECKIHIYTMAGDKVRTLHHNNPNTDYEFWDLLNNSNLKVSYGLYIFVVEIPEGEKKQGNFVILR